MKRISIGLVLAGLMAVNASATVVLIDDFSTTQGPTFVGGFGIGSASSPFQVLGGFERSIYIDATVAGFQAVAVTAAGRWEQATSPSSVNNSGALYQAAGGGGTFDMSGLTFFRITVETVDVVGGTLEFFITDSNGTFVSPVQALTPLAPPSYVRTFVVGGFGGVNLADVQSFGFYVRGVNDIDVALDNFEADFTAQGTPEPTTMAMMGMGLLGLGFLGRRMRK